VPRPRKCRQIGFVPDVTYFKPQGIPMRFLEEVSLSFEEIEAVRLKDMEGLEQEQAAARMEVSRPTFQRILASARNKIAAAILSGKAIRIEGGHYKVSGQLPATEDCAPDDNMPAGEDAAGED